MGYDGDLKFNTKIDEAGFNAGISKLGGIAKKGLAVTGWSDCGCNGCLWCYDKTISGFCFQP